MPVESPIDRKRQLAAIHAAAGKLGMDTADKSPGSEYRTIVREQGREGRTSAADLSEAGRKRVLAYLLHLTNPAGATKPKGGWQSGMVERLWDQLGTLGALNDPTPVGLAAFLRKTQGVDLVRSLTSVQSNKVIEALKAWKARHLAKA